MAKTRKLEATGADRSELRRLLAAAKADHWDDGPRLAIADWLEENGSEADQARAEVVRLQLDEADGGPPWDNRVEALRSRNVREWLGPAAGVFRSSLPGCWRGLLSGFGGIASWLAHDSADLAASPEWDWVEGVAFPRLPPASLAGLMASSLMASVPRLSLEGPLTAAASAFLAGSPAFGRLRSLTADVRRVGAFGTALGLAGADALQELDVNTDEEDADWIPILSAGPLPRLRRLRLSGVILGDEAEARLASCPLLSGLRGLELGFEEPFESTGFRALAASPALAGLWRLELSLATPRDALAVLASASFAASLRELSIDAWGLSIPRTLSLPSLRRLSLANCDFSTAALRSLGRCGLLSGLASLDLSDNGMEPAGLRALLAGSDGPRTLRLAWCWIGDEGASLLAGWPGLARVRRLDLSSCRIGNAGLKALAASPHLSSLEALDLSGNHFAASGMKALLRSPLESRLRWLSLGTASRPDAIIKALLERPPAALRELDFDAGSSIRRLRAALPDCVIG
ncbi:MAG: TIGR02996 domain-containing protein [Gemmataceae bacterium]|nr:TIGR02996 domain-containing protein [Gemmataceae bacterium]